MAEAKASRHSVRLRDGLELSYLIWGSEAPARAGIIFLHGYGEHGARFEALASFLQARGFLFVAPDIRGHGRSGGQRGHVARFDDYLDDLDALFIQLRHQTEVRDWFMVGHSHGGLISLRYVLRHRKLFRGVVISNPLLSVAIRVPPIKAAIGRVTASVFPTLALGNEINRELVSHDPAIVESYRTDPLVHHMATARWFVEMNAATRATMETAPELLQIPVLLLLSTDDHIVDMNATRTLYERIHPVRKQLRIYEGYYHELFNEVGREQIFEDVALWLEQELAAPLSKS